MQPFAITEPGFLARELVASLDRLTQITRDLEGERLLGPKLAIVNPPLWEIGHVAWFQEYWCLRYRAADTAGPSIMPDADALYDSAKVAHDTRWSLPLPDIAQTRGYQAQTLERVLERLQREPENNSLRYFVQLALFHQDMHAEAFHYTRQTLGYSDPFAGAQPREEAAGGSGGDVEIAGGVFNLGAAAGDGFVFDNEKWAHEVRVSPFRIARFAVSNEDYLQFVEADGYARREFWSDEGWGWLQSAKPNVVIEAPRYWSRQGDAWQLRRFDRGIALPLKHPVLNVNWHEAQAYCRYARRRLPTEAEWEYAAATSSSTEKKRRYPWGNTQLEAGSVNLETTATAAVNDYARTDSAAGCRQMIGNVWEWTAGNFDPYPGFVIDPYKEYSEPWFGNHKVLRGGSFATSRRLIRNTWRNFYMAERGDVFAGFRTCAVDA